MENLNKNSVFHANILYFLIGILLITVGSIAQGIELYSGLLITQYLIILIPNLIYLKLQGLSLKKVLKLNKISFKQVLYVIGITTFTYPVAVFFNLVVILFLESFGELTPTVDIIPKTFPMYMLSLFVISIAPGICEEVMFRGTMMNAYEKLSKKKAIIYSAILFGIFHLNLQNLVGPTILGLVFGTIVYKTNSIYSSMIGHGLNNGIAMTIGYFAFKGQENLMGTEAPVPEIEYGYEMIVSLIVIGVFAFISYLILKKLIKNLPSSEVIGEEIPKEDMEIEKDGIPKLIKYLPVLGIVILFVIVNARYLYL